MKWWREIFFFSRTERRGILVLGMVIGMIIFWKQCDRSPLMDVQWRNTLDSLKRVSAVRGQKHLYNKVYPNHNNWASTQGGQLFYFDPNTIPLDSLLLLGFSTKQASAIDRYRKTGARFNSPDDFSRLYVVSESQYRTLYSYIHIRKHPGKRPSEVAVENSDVELFHRKDTGRLVKLPRRDSVRLSFQLFKCELNAVDSQKLLIFPGIGPYTAHKIVQYRRKLGGYARVEQLSEIGLDPEVLTLISNKSTVDRSGIKKMRLDSMSWPRMRQHPYVGPYLTRGFQLYVRYHGYPKSWSELIENQLVTPERVEKLKYYIDIP